MALINAAALSGNRNEELAAIEDLIKKKPDSVSYKERILLMVHEGMKRLGFFGIFLCASVGFECCVCVYHLFISCGFIEWDVSLFAFY